MDDVYDRTRLSAQVGRSRNWNDLMRNLGVEISGGRRKHLQKAVAAHGLDTSHFRQRSPWSKYPDEDIAAAVAASTTLREVALRLGATPAGGTMSHIRRRIAAAGIDIGHFPHMDRMVDELPFTAEEVAHAVAGARSVREVARVLGIPGEDGGTRSAIRRALRQLGLDTSHFSHARIAFEPDRLRALVAASTSYAEVMRGLGLETNAGNHRKVRTRIRDLSLDVSHFTRRSSDLPVRRRPGAPPQDVLRVHAQGSSRISHLRLRRAMEAAGVAYRCAGCGNQGEWRGGPITLHVDHANGDWLDNRLANLRFLCPNCHARTDTWCSGNRGRRQVRFRQPSKQGAEGSRAPVA
ncbi:HNH endonuclease signature motif containing protein [Peterkaempfera griseoplana]|uniref:HNH endonuclease signature motif containing protein n=1 Tax=Peterkaempfera griseoplana TaxID=66896 RepID=UPI0006E30578|nr:HNH endonuclease signature motif containing protein [Peterkaempfera griseoplana]